MCNAHHDNSASSQLDTEVCSTRSCRYCATASDCTERRTSGRAAATSSQLGALPQEQAPLAMYSLRLAMVTAGQGGGEHGHVCAAMQ